MLSPAPERSLAAADAKGASLRDPLFVRLTHWTNTAAFVALVVSGFAILLAHPRLYWGETGALGSPALLTLPLTEDLDQSGWGRSLHFLAAWVCVVNGAAYVAGGFVSQHFAAPLVGAARGGTASPRTARPSVSENDDEGYTRRQATAYLMVVFVLFPLVILTGLSLSPAVMAAAPIVSIFGGHQSARTIHFFVAAALLVFMPVHVAMVCRRGFGRRMRRMITG